MDSPQAVIFKRKSKSRPSQQQRQRDPSPENVSEPLTRDSPSTLASKIKKRNKPQSRLSFGASEQDETDSTDVFQLKKSNLSRQSSTKSKLVTNITPTSSPLPSGPTYDKAYLDQLKASTSSLRRPQPQVDDSYDADMSMDVGDDDSIEGGAVPETLIHPETSVRSAKEKRELMRKSGLSSSNKEEDFVSLSLSRQEDIYQGPHPTSRLMREEDDLGDGDDEFAEFTSAQDRIALGKKGRGLEAAQRKAAMVDSIADVDDEDEESREWELEQIRRGAMQGSDSRSSSIKSKPKAAYKPTPIPPPTPIPTLAPALGRLAQQFSQLTTSHASNTATVNSLAQQREEIDARERELREMVERAEEKRTYFAEFQEWISGVASFLDDKYPQLEKLQHEHMSLLKERHDLIAGRRKEDDEDDLVTVFGSLPREEGEAREEPELDEFGRAIPKPSIQQLRKERMEYRSIRRAHRLKSRRTTTSEDEEGCSTDDELPRDDETAYTEAVSSIQSRGQEILADVKAEEFKDPSKGRWGSWRQRYPDLYVNAWGGLGVVSVWEFWVRLELLGWDPISTGHGKGLDQFRWFISLYEFSSQQAAGQQEDLVASMLGSTVVPVLCKMIEEGGVVDVYSEKDARRFADLVDEVEAGLGEGGVKVQALLKSLLSHFRAVVISHLTRVTAYLQLNSPPFNPASIPSRQRLLNRQVKLLRNLVRFHKRCSKVGLELETARLIRLVIEEGLVRVAEGGWEVGGEPIVRRFADTLPQELKSPLLKSKLGLR